MTWLKVDDGMHSHPKALAAGDAALGLWLRLGSWSCHHLTDGLVPEQVARLLSKPAALRRLVDVGLLDKVAGGYQLHDFLEYNPSREEVEAEREKTARRVADWRARNGASNRSRNGVTNGVRTGAPTRPDPTRTSSDVQREVEVELRALRGGAS